MSEADTLRQIIDNTNAELLVLSTQKNIDYSVSNQSFQHGAYEQKLRDRIAWAQGRLNEIEGAGIFIVSQVR